MPNATRASNIPFSVGTQRFHHKPAGLGELDADDPDPGDGRLVLARVFDSVIFIVLVRPSLLQTAKSEVFRRGPATSSHQAEAVLIVLGIIRVSEQSLNLSE
ncbi:hypothetical protein KCU81_g540, partial [Aureobasidium melanogenum]